MVSRVFRAAAGVAVSALVAVATMSLAPATTTSATRTTAQPTAVGVSVVVDAIVEVEIAPVTVTPRPLTLDEQFERGLLSPAESAAYRVARGDAAQAAAYPNGQIPEHLLCPLSFSDSMLRCDAAEALERAVEAGMPTVALNDSYRSLARQRMLARTLPQYATEAGRSRHGLGLAIDVPAEGGMQDWLRAHPEFGFVQPAWAKPGGNLPEPWHFEYRPAP